MADDPIVSELQNLSSDQAQQVLKKMPADRMTRVSWFLECLRVLDYWAVFRRAPSNLSPTDFTIMGWGWNSVIANFLTPVAQSGAIPVMKSSPETQNLAANILFAFGRSVLLARAAEMLRCGALKAEITSQKVILRKTDKGSAQFLDRLEFSRWRVFDDRMRKDPGQHSWTPFDMENPTEMNNRIGAFWGIQNKSALSELLHPDVDSLMAPLIRPWDSGKGVMMAYDADPDVDNHFFAEAFHCSEDWRNDLGMDPKGTFCDTSMLDVMMTACVIASLHMKHIRFALIAMKLYPSISTFQSLTIWGPESELIESINYFTGLSLARAAKALRAISMLASEASKSTIYSNPFVPLLISLENGLILRPVSCLGDNPLMTVSTLLEWRAPAIKRGLTRIREDWMRKDLYGLFQGSRYSCVEGNVVLKSGGKALTDIDAAVFDRTTGDLGLFQLKWQDYITNDIRQLRSRASNLVSELDSWATRVLEWIAQNSVAAVTTSLRLRPAKDGVVVRIFLFGLSRNTARTQGYGFVTKHEALAIANWPQFLRVRADVGPAKDVINELHHRLWGEMEAAVECKPLPVEVKVAGKIFLFEDLWVSLPES